MEGDFIKINAWLTPFSWLYGAAVGFRNLLFEVGVLKSRSFGVPVISVGNLTVGGTGKTPHVEYLIELLKDQFKVAVLSRGYKRKTNGFILANQQSTAREIGDEPYQIKQKFPDVAVAVDRKRTRGIERLMKSIPGLDVVLLDDAFQHRYVKPDINILLIDYHRLIVYDTLLPAGRLREPFKEKNRADVVIVTKCPNDLKSMEYRGIKKALNLFAYQRLYFTSLVYADLKPLYREKECRPLDSLLQDEHVMLLTGIASPKQLQTDMEPYTSNVHPLTFSDHHQFSTKDVEQINQTFAALPSPKCIITTEKDAARIVQTQGLTNEVRNALYVLPVTIQFLLDMQTTFNDNIIDYVRKNTRNSSLA